MTLETYYRFSPLISKPDWEDDIDPTKALDRDGEKKDDQKGKDGK